MIGHQPGGGAPPPPPFPRETLHTRITMHRQYTGRRAGGRADTVAAANNLFDNRSAGLSSICHRRRDFQVLVTVLARFTAFGTSC